MYEINTSYSNLCILFILLLILKFTNRNIIENLDNVEKLKILYIICVENSDRNIRLIKNNYEKLKNYDEISWCFLHFDGNNDLWKKEEWYNKLNRIKFVKKGCKANQWSNITPLITEYYDYLWFSDGDVGLENFEWNIYKKMLIEKQPLLSQPGVLPLEHGKRASDWQHLNCYTNNKDSIVDIGKKNIECMSPFINSKIWPIIYEKIENMDRRSMWELEKFFNNLVKNLDNTKYVNFMSPIVHHDFRNLQKDDSLKCIRAMLDSPDPNDYDLKLNNIKKLLQ